ncbi:MFS transporter [Micromonospora polyrhachis]|uniref:DHA1 family inner membrane transport protein n=1 Tax=Micromonospora polyrhachis TaxID=1282883 RepID=A0A7W7WN47_9ACTN|nr:MFS transporter [Micromonospora polyrhachis]MBB4957154.1 DHA1 family inner membrane transport protein [Micromonospora polyrhachis]
MKGRPVGALIALSMCAFAFVTTETLPIGLLLPISEDLDVSPFQVGLLVTSYGLVVVLATIPLTRLTGRIPRRFLLAGLVTVYVVSTGVTAAASGYGVLLTARLVTALSQALFWALAIPTASALFPTRIRGRVISVVMAGTSLAAVLGVPTGTWLGEQVGWRTPFLVLSGIGLVAALAIVALVPTEAPDEASSARGSAPDARRYRLLLVLSALAVTGAFASFTYVTSFLVTVSGFAAAATGALLLARGVAGIGGVFAGGVLVDRDPWVATLAPVLLQAVALLGLFTLGTVPVAAVVLVALAGTAFSALTTVLGSRILQVAPGRTDLAAAGISTSINVGITVGALAGGLLLPI